MSSLRSPRSSRSSNRPLRGLIAAAPAGAALAVRRPIQAGLRASPDALLAGGTLVVSRMLVWVAGMWAIVLFGINPALNAAMDFAHVTAPFSSHGVNLLFAPTMRWDSVWYLHIAQAGYDSHQATAFFPVLPLLLRGGGAVLGSTVIAGALISLVCTALGGWLLFRLARLELGERAAGLTVALVVLFPTSLFLSAIYTESLFLALSVGAVYAARRERWALAGLLGGVAAATRSAGVLLLVPLVLLHVVRERDDVARWRLSRVRVIAPRASMAWLVLVPAGLAAYCAYLGIKFGTPMAPFSAEHIWQRSFAGPFGAVVVALGDAPGALVRVLDGTQHPFGFGSPLGWDANQLIDLAFLPLAAAGLWMCARRLPLAYTAYALVMLAQGLSYPIPVQPLQSFPRYLLVIFPIYMGWAAWLTERPLARRLALGGLTLGLVAFSALWALTIWIA